MQKRDEGLFRMVDRLAHATEGELASAIKLTGRWPQTVVVLVLLDETLEIGAYFGHVLTELLFLIDLTDKL